MAATKHCPDAEILRRLASGETADSIPETILTHLQSCKPCSDVFSEPTPFVVEPLRCPTPMDECTEAELEAIKARAKALLTERTVSVEAGVQTDAIPSAVGRTLGKFTLLAELGHGGMGVVYRARDTLLERDVALKLIRAGEAGMTAMQRARFLREARAAAKLRHDNITPVYEVGEIEGTPFIVMPLMVGETLADRLRTSGHLPASEVCRLGGQIASGLAAAHAAGLVHRDVKPSNVWIEPIQGGAVRLLDFGLAKPNEGTGLT